MKKNWFVEIVAFLIAALFIYTGIMKFREHDVFRFAIGNTPVLKPISSVLAWGLPALELVIAVLLLVPALRRKGLYAAFGLMIAFTVYIAANLIFASKLPCNCGGVLQQMTWPQHLVFNIVVTAAAGLALVWEKQATNKVAI
ncbi:Methylamine utilisation protein MauE [Chitinophaga jiangningensis]|uniref:Methylamine utilisation protein MauE n=1 Tax=Chitinophaga jiangningensis TaxID=1419482 RepID=A0A1M7JXF9_9BACT|nr:MauE/DoxX family redox-associated membrane protein [Chitinophaga jiangningensis]SHM57674.1 Methylamine utilisation protein MauE [Chitinophaga jiangningensis]